MRRWNAGDWLLLAVVGVILAGALFILGQMLWRSPEIRDVPDMPTRVIAVTVFPTATLTVTTLPFVTTTPEPTEVLPRTGTRVPETATPTPTATPTVAPTTDKPAVQKG